MKQRIYFWTGITVLVLMTISYFISVTIESGHNYIVETPLLGILIFHNPLILGLYVLSAVVLIFKGKPARFKRGKGLKIK